MSQQYQNSHSVQSKLCNLIDFSQITDGNEKENSQIKYSVNTPNRLQTSSQNNGGYTPNAKNEYASLSGNNRISINKNQQATPQNFSAAIGMKSIDQIQKVRSIPYDTENQNVKKQNYFNSSQSPLQIRNSQDFRKSQNDTKAFFYEKGSPNRNSMNDISLKILNEILSSPSSSRNQANKQNNTKNELQSSVQGLTRQQSPYQGSSPLRHSGSGPLRSSQLNNDKVQIKSQRYDNIANNDQFKQVRNSTEIIQNKQQVSSVSHFEDLQFIKDKIKDKKNQLETKKQELEFITVNISTQNNSCKINSIIESALISKCGDNKKRIEQISNQQIQEKKEITKLEEQTQKNKLRITNLQQKLEIIKQQEQRYNVLKETKIQEAKEEFQKKNQQMNEMYNEVSYQYKEFIENLQQIEENYHIDLETKAFLKEDLNGKLLQRAEIVAQKEDLEQIYEQFVNQYHEEFEYLNEAQKIDNAIVDFKTKIETSTKEQTKFNNQKDILLNKLKEKESYFNHYGSKLQDLRELIKKEKYYPTQTLEQSEKILSKFSVNCNLPDLEIICCNFMIYHFGNYQSQNGAAIQQIVFGLHHQKSGITIDKLLDYFQQTYFNDVNDDQEIFFDNMSLLFTSLVQLEDVNKKYFHEEQEIINQVSKFDLELENIKIELASIQQRIENIQQQFIHNSESLKKYEQSKLVLDENLKIPVKKAAQIVFQQYCDKQKEQIEQIANEHGSEQVENLMKDHRDQFLYFMTLQQQERMEKMKKIKDEKIQLEQYISNNVSYVESEILPKFRSLISDLQNSKMQLDMMHNDLENYKETKNKVEDDMKLLEKCLNQKIKDIGLNLKKQFADVIGKSEDVEVELIQEANQIKEYVVSAQKIKQSLESNCQLEQALQDEISKLVSKLKLIEELKQQKTTVQQETSRRELQIAELEKQIAKLEVKKLVLENPQELQQQPSQSSYIKNCSISTINSVLIKNNSIFSNNSVISNNSAIKNNSNLNNSRINQKSPQKTSIAIPNESTKSYSQQQYQYQQTNECEYYNSSQKPTQIQSERYGQQQKQHSNEYQQYSSQKFLPKNIYINCCSQFTQKSPTKNNNNDKSSFDYFNCQTSTNQFSNTSLFSNQQYSQNVNVMKQSDFINSSLQNIQYSPINSKKVSGQNNQKTPSTNSCSSHNIINKSISSNPYISNSYIQQGSFSSTQQFSNIYSTIKDQHQQHLDESIISLKSSTQNLKQLQKQQQIEELLYNNQITPKNYHSSNVQNQSLSNQRSSQSKSPFGTPRDKVVYYPNTCRTSYAQQTNTSFNSNTYLRSSYNKNTQQNSPKNKNTWK